MGGTKNNLLQMTPGKPVKINQITDLLVAKRLFAMGLLPGTFITLVRKGLSGTCYVKSESIALALRKQEAEAIEVE